MLKVGDKFVINKIYGTVIYIDEKNNTINWVSSNGEKWFNSLDLVESLAIPLEIYESPLYKLMKEE